MSTRKTILGILCIIAFSWGHAQDKELPTFHFDPGWVVFISDWKVQPGDDPVWADPALDDASWSHATLEDARESANGIFWLRQEITLAGHQNAAYPLAVNGFNIPMAFELFWDGVNLGGNGTVSAEKDREKPGRVRRLIRLAPDMTKPGVHHMALRISKHGHVHAKLYGELAFGYLHGIQSYVQRVLDQALVFVGLYFIATLLCVLLYLGGWRQPSFLIFGAYTLFNVIVHGWVYLIESAALSVALFQWLEPLFYLGATASLMLLAVFIFWYFEIPKRSLHTAALILVLILMHVINMDDDARELLVGLILLSYAVLVTAWRWKHRQPGGLIAYMGIGLLLLHHIYQFVQVFITPLPLIPMIGDFSVNVLFVTLIIGSISLRILDHYRQYQVVTLHARRLEKELEKHNSKVPYLICRKGNENYLLPVSGIVYFKAARVLVEAHLEDGRYKLLEKPMNQLEDILPPHYLRIHRSYIVNIRHVKSYRHAGGGVYQAVLKDGGALPISRYRYRAVKDRLAS